MKKVFLIFICSLALNSASLEFKFNSVYGENNFHTIGHNHFALLVKQYTNNEINITVHANNKLVDNKPIDGLKNKIVDFSDVFLPFSGLNETIRMSGLPYQVRSYNEAYLLYQLTRQFYEKEFLKHNIKLLYVVSWPPTGIFSDHKLNTINDYHTLITRTYDDYSANFMKLTGAIANPTPWSEVVKSFETKKINSIVTSSASGKDGAFWKYLTNFTRIKYAYPLQAALINLDTWNSLSPKHQEAIIQAAKKIEKQQWEASKKEDVEALNLLKDNNMRINEISPEVDKKFSEFSNMFMHKFLRGQPAGVKKAFIKLKQSRYKQALKGNIN